mgnify:CR=1 FL=1
MDWSVYPNFSEAEFKCKHCGEVEMRPHFMAKLQQLRNAFGKPMVITSGYRCKYHPVESRKSEPGVHAKGIACDVAVQGTDAYELLRLAFAHGFTGIGVQQKGGGRFIHLDTWQEPPRPNVWSY